MATYATEKRLFRTRNDAYIGGVCAGLAIHYDLDAIVVRILAVLLAGLTLGLACIAYLVLWARIPLESELHAPYDIKPESAESSAFGCVDCSSSVDEQTRLGSIPLLARLAVAVGLMFLFLAVSMGVSPFVPGTHWWQFWPLSLLMGGLCLIIIPVHTRFETAWHAAGIAFTSISASMLPMSLGIMSWSTIGCAFQQLWPLLLAAGVLFGVGLYRRNDALLLLAAFCIVAFCLIGLVFCVVPGEIETLLLHMPSGHSVKIAVVG